MKIHKIALSLIGNPKFCSLQDAFAYAKEDNSELAWEYVAKREDLDIQVALDYARSVRKAYFWKHVLMRTDLETVDAIAFAGSLHTTEAWRTVLERPEITFGRAHAIAMGLHDSVKDWTTWQAVMAKPSLSPSRAIETCTAVDDADVWGTLLKNEAMASPLKEYSVQGLFSLASKANNHTGVLKVIASREDITPEELFECIVLSEYAEIFDLILAREDFKIWLNGLAIDELAEKALKINYEPFWDILLERKDLDVDKAMKLLDINNQYLVSALVELPLVEEHLLHLKVEEAAKLLMFHHSSLSIVLMQRADVVHYLKTYNKAVTFAIYENCSHLKTRLTILRRDDIAMKEIFKLNINSSDYIHIAGMPHFGAYFNRLKIDDAIVLSKKIGSYTVYETLLNRKALTMKKAIELALFADDKIVWKIVLAREDVRKYYGIE